jgi:hypothetical protein
LEITIDLPRKKVIELFDNPDNMKHWQPGLVSFEHLNGVPGEVGAKSAIKYEMAKRTIDMIETVVKRDLPDEFSGSYETKGGWNEVKNYFSEIHENTTLWRSHNEFRCSGFMKLMTKLMPGTFKKQSLKFMKDFKTFAEGDTA